MHICSLKITNYRTIETLELKLPTFYSAISGKNNSGKTNVVKVIRSFFGDQEEDFLEETISSKSDFPNWKHFDEAKDSIQFELDLLVDSTLDAGLHKFITTFLGIAEPSQQLRLSLKQQFARNEKRPEVHLSCDGTNVPDEFKIQEVFKKLRSSQCLLFHNSTEQGRRYFYRRQFSRMMGSLTSDEGEQLKKANVKLINLLKKSAQRHQKEIIELLGRLEEKYHVTLSLPPIDFESIPFMVSLGDKSSTVPLDEWGSGTQNRTLILLNLFRAKKNREARTESDRITPILLIEEPESFLHPSAQAEFGRMLQDLAEEFSVQVLTTTHSPYMLSLTNPSANILLKRCSDKTRLLGTELVPTATDNWMEPFGLALGIDNEAFAQWRHVLFKKTNQIMLVEGDTDKAYLEMLRDSKHGNNALLFDGEIFPYGGTGFFSNTILIKFIMSRFSKFVITYDLDRDHEVAKALQALSLKRNLHFIPVGRDAAGKKDIEGLLPDSVRGAVYSNNADLVAVATSTDKERDSARRKLKQLLLEEFRKVAQPTDEFYGGFYKLGRMLNKAIHA